MIAWVTALIPVFVQLLEHLASGATDPEAERQHLMAIARAIEDKRAADKFAA